MFTFIDSIDDLAYLNKELSHSSYIGVDTEFRRTKKDNMKLALLQVNDDEEIYLIDTLSIDNPEDHANFLFSKNVTKILHSCKEDLEAVFAWTNQLMENVFDTQIANSFLDGEYTISYQGLVQQELGISLEKNETRSNWLRRPLSDSQLKYASLDVEYLIHIYKSQKEALSRSNKLNWLYQDIEKLLNTSFHFTADSLELERSLTKFKEAEMLNKFNDIVTKIAVREKINPTLFFSKKAQKYFLRLIYIKGLDLAFEDMTSWRKELLKEDMANLLG